VFEVILFGLVCLCALVLLICRFVFPEVLKRNPEPWYLDYARSFFPVLLIVFLLRGFIAEPFRIPSGSMYPTLEIGDFILVNKFAYGVRLPISHNKIINVGDPRRGDVVVFRYPDQPSQNYIKRLVGLPGDVLSYKDNVLYVNGSPVSSKAIGSYDYRDSSKRRVNAYQFEEVIAQTNDGADGYAKYNTLAVSPNGFFSSRNWQERVPEGHYFMMGDNRDNSADSRKWGFLPDENVIGKAFFVWMSWGDEENENGGGIDFDRIGADIKAERVSAGVN